MGNSGKEAGSTPASSLIKQKCPSVALTTWGRTNLRRIRYAQSYIQYQWIHTVTLKGEAKREYQRLWLARRRADWIESQGGVCVKCGSSDELEIDHIDPSTKNFNVAHAWSRSADVMQAELAKCQVLCHECHLDKTYGKNRGLIHGTTNGYKWYSCRCSECRAANTAMVRRQRLANSTA